MLAPIADGERERCIFGFLRISTHIHYPRVPRSVIKLKMKVPPVSKGKRDGMETGRGKEGEG